MFAIRHLLHLLAAIAVTSFPALVALDLGGVLDWDWWLLAAGSLVLVALAGAGESEWAIPGSGRIGFELLQIQFVRWFPLLFCGLLTGLAMFQQMPLPATLVGWMSPGIRSALADWFAPATGLAPPDSYPLSLWPSETKAYAWRALAIAGFAYTSAMVFRRKDLIVVLLTGLTATGILHATIGLYQHQKSPLIAWNYDQPFGVPFGAFLNRNNAGALLNLSLAGAVGLIVVRVHQRRFQRGDLNAPMSPLLYRTRQRRGRTQKPRGLRLDSDASTLRPKRLAPTRPHQAPSWTTIGQQLLKDPLAVFATFGVFLVIAAMFVSGSRGALLGTVAGTVGWLALSVPARLAARIASAIAVVVLVVLLSLNQLDINTETFNRIDRSFDATAVPDGRFSHWPDALRASWHYLPAGAGLGAYRFAYLPFQSTSGDYWALNADNQWLEWFVEGGLPMLILMGAAGLMVIHSLRRLFRAPGAEDRGLASSGVFAVSAIVVSQSFDFALTQGSIAALAIAMAAAIAARATCDEGALPRQSETTGRRLFVVRAISRWFPSTSSADDPMDAFQRLMLWRNIATWVRYAAPVLLVGLLIFGVRGLSNTATSDALVSRLNLQFESGRRAKPIWLKKKYQELVDLNGRIPRDYQVWSARAQLQIQMFRASQADHIAATSNLSAQSAYRHTLPLRLRQQLAWDNWEQRVPKLAVGEVGFERHPEMPTYELLTENAAAHLKLAAHDARTALLHAPLADIPRWQLMLLDLAETDPRRSRICLEHLATLRQRSPASQLDVARAAIASQDWLLASSCMRSALRLGGVRFVAQVFTILNQSQGQIRLTEVVPEDRATLLRAVEYHLKWRSERLDPEIVDRALKYLQSPRNEAEAAVKQQLNRLGAGGSSGQPAPAKSAT